MANFEGRYSPFGASGGSGGAITSINADATAAQLLTTGTSGTDFAIVDAGSGSHVFNLPIASASNTGKLSSTDWSTFNNKAANGFAYLSSNASVYGGTFTARSFTGADSVVLGVGAGAAITSGSSNTAIGHNALAAAVTSVQCVAVGAGALQTTTNSNNIGIGYFAGNALTSGHDNTLMGLNAAAAATSGSNNTVIGSGAAGTLTTGHDNSMIGFNAGNLSTTGSYNVVFGSGAFQNGKGDGNCVFGYQTLNNATAAINNSVAFGSGALGGGALTGSNNIAVGFNAANNLTAGANSIFLGYYSGFNATTTSNEFFLNNVQESSYANDKAYSLLYGNFSGSAASLSGQQLTINGTLNVNGTTATSAVLNSAAKTTITGNAGTAVCSQPEQGSSYKKVIVYLAGYTNNGTQNYTYPVAFSNTPVAIYTGAGITPTIGTTTVSVASTTVTGFLILEGY